jgi:hypothetical protein
MKSHIAMLAKRGGRYGEKGACEAPLRHYSVTGTRKGNRTYFEDSKGRRWMMIEEGARTTITPH